MTTNDVQQLPVGTVELADDVMRLRSCAVLQLDGNGRILGCNAGVHGVFGFRPDELVGRDFACLFSSAEVDRGSERTALAKALTHHFEHQGLAMKRKDGTRFRAGLTLERVDGGLDERPPRILMLVRDLTDFFQTQKRVNEAQEIAMRAQRLDAVGKLTLGLSHDFNNLLSVIANSLDMLAARRTGDESARRILDIAHRAVERGTQLTRQMLAFGRGQTLVPEVSDVGYLLQSSLDLYRRVCGQTIQLNIQVAQGLPQIAVDSGQLEAALLNLMSNSRDAMHGVGKVMLEARLETVLLPGGADDEDFVCITVGDSGPGIQAEIQESVFEPFFTTKSVGDGSGLGLSQVYGFASQSGGTATIGRSGLGGAAVSLYFPVVR